jgi:hypothetical protein
MKLAEIAGWTNREPEKTFDEIMVAMGDSLSNVACSDDGEDAEDEDDQDIEQGMLSEDDNPSWVIGTITKTVQQRMERFRQKQMKLDAVTQPGWQDASEYCGERDKTYSPSELVVPAVVQPPTDYDTTAPSPTTCGDLIECLEIVPGIS